MASTELVRMDPSRTPGATLRLKRKQQAPPPSALSYSSRPTTFTRPKSELRFVEKLIVCGIIIVVMFGEGLFVPLEYVLHKGGGGVVTSTETRTWEFREYPSNQYFDWKTRRGDDMSSLTDSDYLFGEWPKLLNSLTLPVKLYTNQGERRRPLQHAPNGTTSSPLMPWSDGTNPSILSRRRLEKLAPAHTQPLWYNYPRAAFVAVMSMMDGKCARTSGADKNEKQTKGPAFLVLDASFKAIAQFTILLQLDSSWANLGPGELLEVVPGNCVEACHSEEYDYETISLPSIDSIYLFIHDAKLWVGYHSAAVLGTHCHRLNPLRFGQSAWPGEFGVEIKASQTSSAFGGNDMDNIAILPNDPRKKTGLRSSLWSMFGSSYMLLALQSVDPLRIDAFDTRIRASNSFDNNDNMARRRTRRNLGDEQSSTAGNHTALTGNAHRAAAPEHVPSLELERQLQSRNLTVRDWHVHNTNTVLAHLVARHEYLGIAHFRRSIDQSADRRYDAGLYTHCFYTISDRAPYILTRLSPEFVFPAAASVDSNGKQNWGRAVAEKIQYWSGLELVESDDETADPLLVIAYGINGCESAVRTLRLSAVESLLRPVVQDTDNDGKPTGVGDYMVPL